MLEALSARLAEISGADGKASFDPNDVRGARACFLIAREAQGRAVGCAALRPLQDGVGEVKRMYARPGTRGVGSALLTQIESRVVGLGYAALWLETRRVNTQAVAFYQARGYQLIDNYGRYVGRSEAVCFGKTLQLPA
ncbi:GNAT family N-acetyltransferase [Hydrocarboniphaga sp.]|uniref:GNAT family N-acetyltransferase n=1 Tax=Hydrocarboniphaga sp. TaxID=2033016 RepID=UPI003D0E5D37